jgi:site-specific DNA-methyltransferase (adenine-specific)
VQGLSDGTMNEVVSPKRPFGLRTNFIGNRDKASDDDVVLYRSGGTAWVERDRVEINPQWIDEWKVLTPKAGPGNSGGHVIPDMVTGRPQIAGPGSCCTETFIVVGPVDSEAEAESMASYMRTRFFRFLVSLRKVSQDAPRGTYAWVPIQPWDRMWTDEELYDTYSITQDEQSLIAENIREMPA